MYDDVQCCMCQGECRRVDPNTEGKACATFYRGLADNMKDELASRDEPESLDRLLELSIRIDNRLRERRRERSFRPLPRPLSPARGPPASPRSPESSRGRFSLESEPMQIGRTGLSPEERERRRVEGACFYCGQSGHTIANCTTRSGNDRARR